MVKGAGVAGETRKRFDERWMNARTRWTISEPNPSTKRQTFMVNTSLVEGDEVLSTKQAAALCSTGHQPFSIDRMRALAQDGRVTAEFAHNRWYFSRAELERMIQEEPQVLYGRRVRQMAVTTRERSRAAMLRINALRTTSEREQYAAKARAGLRAKFALEVDPRGSMSEAEREARVGLLMKEHMAMMRSHLARPRRGSVFASNDSGDDALAEIEAEAIHKARAESRRLTRLEPPADSEPFCFGCWRERWHKPPPTGIANTPCERHQAQIDGYRAQLLAAS